MTMTKMIGQRDRPTPNRPILRILLAAVIAMGIWSAGVAKATPELVPLDAPTLPSTGSGYGFLDPASYGFTEFNTMTNYYKADSVSPRSDENLLLEVDPKGETRCPNNEPNCSDTFHIFETTWDITLNPMFFTGNDTHDVNLILVDSDSSEIFDSITVSIYFDSATIEGIATDFEIAEYGEGSYYFLDLALDDMIEGSAGTRRVTFRYQVLGELPLNPDTSNPGRLYPTIQPAAYARPIPEPGTGLMVGFGLVGFALRSNVRAKAKRNLRECRQSWQRR